MQERPRTPLALLRGLLLAGGALHLGAVLLLALGRIPWPYELEWMEGGCVDAVQRVLDGRTIYPEPSLEFIPFLYTPLYFWLCAPVMALLGPGYAALRLTAFAASLGSMAAIGLLVRRETGSAFAGTLAGLFFAACFELTGAWLDVSRADTLFLLLVVVALGVLRFRGGTAGGMAWAGAAFFLAFLAKQTALFVVVPMTLWAVLVHGRRALALPAVFGALALASTAWLQRATDGHYLYYVIEAPGGHALWERYAIGFWTEDLGRPLWPALAVGACAFASRGAPWLLPALRGALPALLAGGAVGGALAAPLGTERAGAAGAAVALAWLAAARPRGLGLDERGRALSFHLAALLALLFAGWYVRSRTGSFQNIVIPSYGGVALLFGLGLARAEALWRAHPAPAAALLLLGAFQLFHLRYDPRKHLPAAEQTATWDAFVARLAELEGEVFVPEHPWIATRAGKPSHAHRLGVQDCPTERVLAELSRSLRGKRFGAVLLDRRWQLAEEDLRAGYEEVGPFVDRPLRPMTGLFARNPPTLWLPKGGPR